MDDLHWKLSVSGKRLPLKHILVSDALCKHMVSIRDSDDKKLVCLDMFKEGGIIMNKLTSQTKSTSSVSRNVYGYSFLFAIIQDNISKIKISKERMSKLDFSKAYPLSTHAFAENWNLHRVQDLSKGQGNLVIIETKKDNFNLCVSIYTNKEKGIYL